jgi:D-alanyl-D-alanine carboxypeptidase
MKKIISILLCTFIMISSFNLKVFAKDSPPEVSADNVVLMDGLTGEILYSKNPDAAYPPASTTKTMTALLTLENSKLDDKVIVAVAAKKAENDNSLILRLFEPTGKSRTSTLLLPGFTKRVKLKFAPFEIKTLKISPNGSVKQVDLLERSYQKGN